MSDYWDQKRREPRINLRIPVTIKGKDTNEDPFEESTFTENVSRTGACIISAHRMNIGAVLELEAFEKFRNRARVSIIWVDTENPQSYKMGLKFINPVNDWIVR